MTGELVTAEGYLQWRGTLLGWPETPWALQGMTGWLDLPDTRLSNLDIPGAHGQFPGALHTTGRVVEATWEMAHRPSDFVSALPGVTEVSDDEATQRRALADLVAATALDDDPVEEPLVVWSGTDTAQLVFARVARRAIPTDREFSLGYRRATVQWVCSDPRRYSVVEQGASVGLPVSAAGALDFSPPGLAFPLDFHTSSRSGGTTVITNTGDVTAWPTFTITGPVTGPVIRNATTDQALVFDQEFTVAAGQTLTITTAPGFRDVLWVGQPARSRMTSASWFGLRRGATTIAFDSTGAYSSGALLTVSWRTPWL